MKEIDEFLEFLLEHESDDRISFTKKMKYGFRYYYISFNIDEKPEDPNQSYGTNGAFTSYRISDSVEIIIDNRNVCIELIYDNGIENIIIEDKEIIDKWNDKLEKHINKDISEKAKSVIENTLSSCYNKNLHREYQMKKILPDNESI